ncbi:class I SAM-dependent methyltransferase [Streptomyces sp. WAC06614]|uniref:class I SAM-dependent methyltransferase n=1 Tax=Streptomyces sp. WAC06614 TaxID=2487416 RepID=UPI000F76C4C7|nr:methyltransferase [Streptomyces sp. WAC06614]RSS81242.1 methyltransferase domain-containing protein [Streptomyces sp. WAC06614]
MDAFRTFLAEAARDFSTTGAVAPSSRRLAAVLAAPLRERTHLPLTVLEVGAGTGAVTRELLPLLGPGSRLDVVEQNPRFTRALRRLVTHAAPGVGARTTVHQTPVEELETTRRYDVIVSSLPFTNFAPAEVDALMDRYFRLLHPGGTLVYFAYRGSRHARYLLRRRAALRRQLDVDRVLARYHDTYGAVSRTVWTNVPPARVWALRARRAHPQGLEGPGQATVRSTVDRPR